MLRRRRSLRPSLTAMQLADARMVAVAEAGEQGRTVRDGPMYVEPRYTCRSRLIDEAIIDGDELRGLGPGGLPEATDKAAHENPAAGPATVERGGEMCRPTS